MKKVLFLVTPIVSILILLVALIFFKVDHKISMATLTIAVPIVILVSYFIFLQRSDISLAISGFSLSSIVASLSIGVLYLIRGGEFFIPDFSPYQLVTVTALVLSVAAIEEFIFRWFVLGALTRYLPQFPMPLSLLIQAIFFSASHLGKEPLFYLHAAVAGLFLGWTAVKTKSLWYPIGFHFGWDLIIVFATGYHSNNLGHLKGMLVFDSNYGYLQNFVFIFFCGISFCLVAKFPSTLHGARKHGH